MDYPFRRSTVNYRASADNPAGTQYDFMELVKGRKPKLCGSIYLTSERLFYCSDLPMTNKAVVWDSIPSYRRRFCFSRSKPSSTGLTASRFSTEQYICLRELEIRRLIDWQHSTISPFFMQCAIPNSLQEYDEEVSGSLQEPGLPGNFNKLELEEQYRQAEADEKLKICQDLHGVGREGWVPNDQYEETKARETALKKDTLDQLKQKRKER
ncbi:hypothetical protein ASPNIDRAFT_124037 [Aspergillus niger ATCC 1015]|uniref:Uncharacterized protein n=1 Tax=Aspergillus niger (strain ATCC 1015 / CBS 113.46 / FGSC A1144 / LSHB Ac4 / NCTC 3858a / NRRL 328 / USDA 3528.7) TaxID=380704 RepID=G3XTT8_ASPNA|nr:hypothetical protein ASPNIDRAFT_124037 [Aspergillus niger ATCC 1015]